MFRETGFRTSGLRHIPLKQALEGISEAGYSTVEFCLEHPEASCDTLKLAGDSGLTISAISYHGKRDDPEERLRRGRRAIDLACRCGVEVVVLGSPLTGMESFLREAAELYDLCIDKGIKPAWETEPGTVLDSLEEFRTLIQPLGDTAGMNLDAGHLHLQGTCTAETIENLGKRIHHVHVEGMLSGVHRHLIPGMGNIDWNGVLNGLSTAGYAGSLTVDLFDLPCRWLDFIKRANIALKDIISYYPASMN